MGHDAAWEPVEYAVFRKMDVNVVPGMPAKTLILVGVALLLGVALFLASGLLTCQVEKATGYEQMAATREHYTQMRAAIRVESGQNAGSATEMGEADYLRTSTLSGMDDEEIAQLAREGQEAGMTEKTTIAQASAMAPTTSLQSECAVPMAYRLVLALAPAVVTAALLFEVRGVSLAREIDNALSWSRAQKIYYHG